MPAREVIEKALGAIKRGADYEYFFHRIQSPDWILPLWEAGLFQNPPGPVREGDYVRFPIWAESRYLVRMAEKAPELVKEILSKLPLTENVRVYEDVAEAALAMPAGISAQLLPKIKEGLESSYQLLLPQKVGALLPHLAKAGETSSALDLARNLLSLLPPYTGRSADEDFISREPQPRIRSSDYEDILKEYVSDVIRITKERGFDLLCDLLDSALEPAKGEEADNQEDYSHIWHTSIERDSLRGSDDVKNLLVSAVRDAAEQLGETDANLLKDLVPRLEKRRRPIFRRLVLYLIRKFPNAVPDRIVAYLTDRSLLEDNTVWREYSLLLESHFASLPEDAKAKILKMILDGPILNEEVWQALTPAELTTIIDRWRLARLWAIREDLPKDRQGGLEELVAKYGQPEHPLSPFAVTATWVGPTSPKTFEELKTMATQEVIRFLRDWQPPSDPMSPSAEGLGRMLTDVVAKDPERFGEAAHQIVGLDPTYVRAFFSGFRNALKEGRLFPWSPVLSLASWVLEQPREIHERKGRYADVDPGWVWTRQAIAELFSSGLERHPGEPPQDLRAEVWAILRVLAADPDPTPEHEAQYGGTNMDPPTLAINTVRGDAMHAIMRYGLWIRRHQENTPKAAELIARGFEEMTEVQAELEKHLDIAFDPSLAIRSVYGQWLPWLILLDRKWASNNLERIFPSDPNQRPLHLAAWETYISFCYPYNDAFDLLLPIYTRAVKELSGTPGRGSPKLRDPERNLAEHLMVFYWRGKVSLDTPLDLLPAFFGRASVELRRHALEFVGRSLKESSGDRIPDETKRRLKSLWDSRIAAVETSSTPREMAKELEGFGRWFVADQFDDDWMVQQLKRLLRLGGRAEPTHLVIERLVVVADRLPAAAAECLRLVVEGTSERWAVHAWRDEARNLLSKLLTSTDPRAREEAERTVHLLGARGFLDFRDMLSLGKVP